MKVVTCLGLLGIVPMLSVAREITPLGSGWAFQFQEEPVIQVTVPHSWNAVDAAEGAKGKKDDAKSVNATVYKRGPATYTQTLTLTPQPGKRYFLRCGGASIVSEILVNGISAGTHEGAFTAFCYEVTKLLKAGDNTIVVKVDNSHRDHIAPQRGDFSMFGGLYRPVELITTDATCIDPVFYASPGVFITTKSLTDDQAVVAVKTLVNGAAQGEIAVAIKDADGKVVATGKTEAAQEAVVELTVPQPIRWDGTRNPYLYTVTATLTAKDGSTDEVSQPLGLRTIGICPKKGFILNGKAMQVRGVCRHQDMHGKGWALSPADEDRDIQLIVDMGATGLRTAHYPQSTHIYDLADKAGLIVWSEVSNVNLVRGTEDFRKNNRQQALEMIYQHGNHPCIAVWGIYNEIYHQWEKAMQECNMEDELIALNKFIKEIDPTRPTVAASNQPGKAKLNNIPDHIAYNSYPGWYGGGPDTMKANLAGFIKDHPNKGVGISEYGHGASIYMHENPPKRPSPAGFWHPEEYQSYAHEINYRCIQERPEIWGTFVWNMFDFGSSARYEGDSPGINDKGLVTYDRKTPKDAYYFYQANWRDEPMVYITSRRFAERTSPIVPVKIYSNAAQVTLSVNGEEVGTLAPDAQKRAVWEKVTLKPGKNVLTATAVVDGKTVTDTCTWTLTSGPDKYQSPKIKKYK